MSAHEISRKCQEESGWFLMLAALYDSEGFESSAKDWALHSAFMHEMAIEVIAGVH